MEKNEFYVDWGFGNPKKLVTGVVIGSFGCDKRYQDDWGPTPAWPVTHIPTGYGLFPDLMFTSECRAVSFISHLNKQNVDWGQMDHENKYDFRDTLEKCVREWEELGNEVCVKAEVN